MALAIWSHNVYLRGNRSDAIERQGNHEGRPPIALPWTTGSSEVKNSNKPFGEYPAKGERNDLNKITHNRFGHPDFI